MIAHYPQLRRGAATGLVSKFGGLPWGLSADRWPTCAECGRPMSHLAQMFHGPLLVQLPPFGVLFLFKCEWDSVCSFWEHDSGANAALLVHARRLGDAPTPAPTTHPDGAPRVLDEIGVVGWTKFDDGIAADQAPAYFDHDQFFDLPEDKAWPLGFDARVRTKVGGVPSWTANGPQGAPPGRFLMQMDNWLCLDGEPPNVGSVDDQTVELANFCLDGTAYVFFDNTALSPTYGFAILR